jgi:hypothetical protein
MVNNSTDTNKKNNHLSSPTIEHKQKTMAYDMEIQVLAWKRHRHVGVKGHPYYEDKQPLTVFF